MGAKGKGPKADGERHRKRHRAVGSDGRVPSEDTSKKQGTLSEEKVLEVARGMLTNIIFSSDSIRPDQRKQLMHLVFMPTAFLSKEDIDKMREEDITMFYEFMDKAGPRAINGLPMFTSMHMVSRADHARINAKYDELEKLLFPERHKKDEEKLGPRRGANRVGR